MSIFHNTALAGASGAAGGGAGGYPIQRSLRFNSSDSAFCGRSFSSAGNQKTWSWSAWVKKCNVSTQQAIWSAGSTGTNRSSVLFQGGGEIRFFNYAGSVNVDLVTTPVFRDPSAWYHILVAVDTTQATSTNRFKLYVNGTQITTFSTATYPSQNQDLVINSAITHGIGRGEQSGGEYFDGYLADVIFIDGQQLTPSSLVETSATTGQLIPKQYTGSFGTNGFWLKFSDNSAATATTLGKDYSGNNNNWTPNNFSVLSSYTDTFLSRKPDGTSWTNPTYAFDGTTANYADGTYNNGTVSTIRFNKPLTGVTLLEYFYDGTSTYGYNSTDVGTGPNLTGGSWVTVYSGSAITVNNVRCTSQPGNGVIRLYAIRVNGTILNNWTETDPPGCDSTVDTPSSAGTDTGAGGEVRGNYATWNPLDIKTTLSLANGNLDATGSTDGRTRATLSMPSGKWYWEITANAVPISDSNHVCIWANNVALSNDNYRVVYRSDGAYVVGGTLNTGWPSWTAGDVIGVTFDADTRETKFYKNNSLAGTVTAPSLPAGSLYTPAMILAGSNSAQSANFGQRQWAYAAPSGFRPLVDTLLPAPVVAKPSEVMDVKLWTGNGGNQSITLPGGFNPDLVWVKSRSNAQDHYLFDAVRGGASILRSNTTGAESTGTTYLSFDTSGFSSLNGLSSSGYTYAGWCFDAGSNTVSNTAGSITSSVRANVSAGFSIVTYTGTATTGSQTPTVGHGLNVTPKLVITKRRDGASDWVVQTDLIPQNYLLYLNSTAAQTSISGSGVSNIPLPTSSVFTAAYITGLGVSGQTHVAYCFAPVAGYSSFGSYTGNGSTDGPFVYTGFRPKFIIVKSSSFAEYWEMYDASRDTYNVASKELFANASNAESTYAAFDFLSNGFKMRNTGTGANSSGQTYIYCAWAESPFQYARAR